MNSKLLLTIEILLVVSYLVLIMFIFDTSKVSGIIQLGIATVVIFMIVFILEKKRERALKEVETMTSPIPQEAITPSAPTQQQQSAPITNSSNQSPVQNQQPPRY